MKRLLLLLLTTLMLVLLFGCNAEKIEPMEEDMKVINEKTVNVENEENSVITDEETVKVESEENTDAIDDQVANFLNKKNEYNETNVGLATKEDIMELFDFSEEDFEGIDVEGVIKNEKLLKKNIKEFFTSKESCLEYFQFCNEDIKTDIGYLFKGGQPDGKIPFSQIKTIAFLEIENVYNYYWQIHVWEKKAYYCMSYNDHMNLEECAVRSGVITDKYIDELLNCLEKANLNKWKAKYEGNNEDTSADWGWVLGIELVDGTVYTWTGWGIYGDNKPKEFESVKDVIEKFT